MKFLIYKCANLDIHSALYDKKEVTEEEFDKRLRSTLDELFKNKKKLEKALPEIKQHILTKPGALTIVDASFEIIHD